METKTNLSLKNVSVLFVTPEIAKKFLSKNDINRPLKPYAISDYSRQMGVGLWEENTGIPLLFATDGTLLDGQQRLSALIKANISMYFYIIKGLDKDVFSVIDKHLRRTSADTFHSLQIENSSQLSSGIRRYFNLKSGKLAFASAIKISDKELLTLYYNRVDFWNNAIVMCRNWYSIDRMLSPSDYLAFYAFFRDIDEDGAFDFMSMLGEGINLSIGSPIKALRDRLITSKSNPKLKLMQFEKTALIIKAWNLFRQNKSVKILKLDDGFNRESIYYNMRNKENWPIAI